MDMNEIKEIFFQEITVMFLDIRCLGGGKVREKFVAPVVKRLFWNY